MYVDSNAEACPISEELLGHIYRTGPDGVEAQSRTCRRAHGRTWPHFATHEPICTRSVSPSRQPATSAP